MQNETAVIKNEMYLDSFILNMIYIPHTQQPKSTLPPATDCKWSDFINGVEGAMDSTIKDYQALVGLSSVFIQAKGQVLFTLFDLQNYDVNITLLNFT